MPHQSHPFIDETSDPGNPIFRYRLDPTMEFSFSLQSVLPEMRATLADRIAGAIHDAYEIGCIKERDKIRSSLRNALMM